MGKRGKKRDPLTPWRVSLRKDKKYRYAVTQEYVEDKETGKEKQHYVLWGAVTDDMVFVPGPRYKLASKETRDKLIFPSNWDMSKILSITGGEAMNPGIEEERSLAPRDVDIPDATQEDTKTEQQYHEPVKNGAPNPIGTQLACMALSGCSNVSRITVAYWMT